MKTLITNIGILAGTTETSLLQRKGSEMKVFETHQNAWLLVEDGFFKDWGTDSPPDIVDADIINAEGGAVLPSFCDSHTHLVYADSREQEFVDKIKGLSYEEIARRGGGILNSTDRLHQMSEDELYEQSMHRIDEIIRKGTGAVEIKSGYGLRTEDELKMLRVIRRIRETSPIKVVSTFLGAHAVARGMTQKGYVELVISEMIPAVASLADFIDVFCDRGFFTPEETARILEAGAHYGLRPKIHGQELADSGGVEVAVKHQALSVDHLESMTDRDIKLLHNSDTMPTCLPGTSFFLNMPFAPARKMIDEGLGIAIASDYNPGSTPSGDMRFCVSLACIKMRLLPEEAFNAVSINSAYAMGVSDKYGSIAKGKVANFLITKPLPSLAYIPYAYTQPFIREVYLHGCRYNNIYP
jgi:imidazolonepropionase